MGCSGISEVTTQARSKAMPVVEGQALVGMKTNKDDVELLDNDGAKTEEYKRIGYEIQKNHIEPLQQLTEWHRVAYLHGKPCTIEFSKDTFIPEEKLDTMLSALEVVSETWESNGLFTGTIRTEINLTARQICGTSLITNDTEEAKLYDIILQPFREHLEATLGPQFIQQPPGKVYCEIMQVYQGRQAAPSLGYDSMRLFIKFTPAGNPS